MRSPRVFLADDHKLLVEAFRKLLEPACEVVGTSTNGHALLRAAPALNPDIILLDFSMPRLNGLDAARQLRRLLPDTKLIILTVNDDPDLASTALEAGVSGYLLKTCAASELFEAINAVLKGRRYVTARIRKGMEESFVRWGTTRRPVRPLTPRQREIVQLLAEGNTMKETASLLRLAPRTVAFHKYRVMEVHGLKSNADLIQFAIGLKVVAPSPRYSL